MGFRIESHLVKLCAVKYALGALPHEPENNTK